MQLIANMHASPGHAGLVQGVAPTQAHYGVHSVSCPHGDQVWLEQGSGGQGKGRRQAGEAKWDRGRMEGRQPCG